uniref:Uncharacterized protein n=1 Tax=Physcomitrium patens TaxID=3218 RepID=A0A2K1L7Y8_PHYPA|nr:hypothetical protein PHYPA_000528 [Physcomitrium patens]
MPRIEVATDTQIDTHTHTKTKTEWGAVVKRARIFLPLRAVKQRLQRSSLFMESYSFFVCYDWIEAISPSTVFRETEDLSLPMDPSPAKPCLYGINSQVPATWKQYGGSRWKRYPMVSDGVGRATQRKLAFVRHLEDRISTTSVCE